MALPVIDGTGSATNLKSTFAAGNHTPHHNIDVLPPLPTGGNVIGLVGQSGTWAVTMTPGSGAANLGKVEDGPHTTGDLGVFILSVRNDAFATSFTGADLDYNPIATDVKGRLGIAQVIPGTAAADLGKAEDAVHGTGDTGVMALAVRKDTAAALAGADGDYAPLEVDANGRLHTNLGDGVTIVATGAAVPAKVMFVGGTDGANARALKVASDGGLILDPTSGACIYGQFDDAGPALPSENQTAMVRISGDRSLYTQLRAGAGDLHRAEDAASASGDPGIQALAVRRDTPAAGSGTSGDYEAVQTDAMGNVRTTPMPTTAGGCSVYKNLDIDEVGQLIKNAPGQIYCIHAFNSQGLAARYLKFYDKATAPTVGTDVPIFTIKLGGTAGMVIPIPPGVAFTLGIGIGATTGLADNDTGAPSANDVFVTVFYK